MISRTQRLFFKQIYFEHADHDYSLVVIKFFYTNHNHNLRLTLVNCVFVYMQDETRH